MNAIQKSEIFIGELCVSQRKEGYTAKFRK